MLQAYFGEQFHPVSLVLANQSDRISLSGMIALSAIMPWVF
jgi:hypothetical protein